MPSPRTLLNVLLICKYAHPKACEVMPTKLPKATLSLRAWITAGRLKPAEMLARLGRRQSALRR
jgi:hypothetical protein